MKNDRQTYKLQYSPSGGLVRRIFDGLPLARGDTGSEGIAQLLSANVIPSRRPVIDARFACDIIKLPAYRES